MIRVKGHRKRVQRGGVEKIIGVDEGY